MSALPAPPPLDQIGQRPFSFYPAILGIEQNEWVFRRATWSEVLVHNTKTGADVWIPRRFLGEASRIDEPVVIIGLLKELEYKGGLISPHERRVLEIPRPMMDPVSALPPEMAEQRPAPVSSIRLEGGAESRVGRRLLGAVALGILACVVVILILRDSATRVTYTPVMQAELGFTGADDYFSITNKLGPPKEDRWRSEQGEMQFRLLKYPRQGLSIILMGIDRKDVRYIGALDPNWHVIHATNDDTRNMLRALKRF
jgi:hypothetical protein